MIKPEARPMATELIQELKVLYPTKRALFEELGKAQNINQLYYNTIIGQHT